MSHSASRRKFMQALAACLSVPAAALAAAPQSAPATALIDQFLVAGSNLLGIRLDDRDLAQKYLTLLRQWFTEAELKKFVAANAPGKASAGGATRKTSAIERQAMLLWLNGYGDDTTRTTTVMTFTGAAVWTAMPFTKPPGWCGGEFGYWSRPPVKK
jgi:hypothetical protein